MELPPGPRAPALWQTLAWMARPGAFLQSVHERFGDPATIRTYWTEQPMVLFSGPDAVREVFALDPAIAPAGQSWEFVRPFAGPHSILLLGIFGYVLFVGRFETAFVRTLSWPVTWSLLALLFAYLAYELILYV